eukprot:GHVL01007769.1.p1 GENE.GHVL01007769.1~~GHVL01007769.1.p1  ORF type:complete len:151 (-),score=13.54 GHVL01007769.1:101-553(-)
MSTREIEKKHVLINRNGIPYCAEETPTIFQQIITSKNYNEIKNHINTMMNVGLFVIAFLIDPQFNGDEEFIMLMHEFPDWINHDMKMIWSKAKTLETYENICNRRYCGPDNSMEQARELKKFTFYKDKVEDLVVEGIEIVRRRRRKNLVF